MSVSVGRNHTGRVGLCSYRRTEAAKMSPDVLPGLWTRHITNVLDARPRPG